MPLNMTNLRKTEEWAKEKRSWCLSDIYATVAKVAVSLSNGWPRNLYAIMLGFISKFERQPEVYSISEYKMIDISLNDLVDRIYAVLYSIKRFRELNLTTLEYLNGVDVDTDDRANKWFEKSDKDFIDLEAFKQNIYCELRSKLIEEHFFNV